MVIETVLGDITALDVDVVVNAANRELARGSGVCGAIFAAAGPRLDAACAALGSCDTGDAVITPGFGLGARWIVHTVGPIWHGGASGEGDLLASCYRRSLEVAGTVGAESIAFPAISTGAYGYPIERAAPIALDAAVRHLATGPRSLVLVLFVLFAQADLEAFAEALAAARAE